MFNITTTIVETNRLKPTIKYLESKGLLVNKSVAAISCRMNPTHHKVVKLITTRFEGYFIKFFKFIYL
jgi:hypothetical protein